MKVIVEYKPELLGKVWIKWRPWLWSIKDKNGDLITVSQNLKPKLIAVTKAQYKGWNNQKLTAQFRWFRWLLK